MMSGGVMSGIKTLEKDVIEFFEKEVKELEGLVDEKSKYTERFKGDVFEKHDPYDADQGDHQVQASESSVPDADHAAEWFSAVKGIASRKARSGVGTQDSQAQDNVSGSIKNASLQKAILEGVDKRQANADVGINSSAIQDVADKKSDGGSVEPSGSHKDRSAGAKGNHDASSQEANARHHKDKHHHISQSALHHHTNGEHHRDNESNRGLKKQHHSGHNSRDSSGGASDDDQEEEGQLQPRSEHATSHQHTKHPHHHTNGEHHRDNESNRRSARNFPHFNPKEDDNTDSPETSQSIEDNLFHKKSHSLLTDLKELSHKGKQAKEKKEILRGMKRTLEEPHKLFRDHKRLAAMRSGDHEKMRLSLKRHGRSIQALDDPDPQDISADPIKLHAVRSNHRLAMRHMINMGHQYGKDPFDGISPQDVQDIIEHHAANHPHKKHKTDHAEHHTANHSHLKHKTNYHPSRNRVDHRDEDSYGDTKESEHNSHKHNSPHHSHVFGANHSDIHKHGHKTKTLLGDHENNDASQNSSYAYPGLDKFRNTDSDYYEHAHKNRPKHKKNKRKYPHHHVDNNNPSDLQLACDSLSDMAADGDEDEIHHDAPLHKKKAHAAKKILRSLNRIRAFQEDPAAWEGAFIDEAEEEEVRIAGSSPNELEKSYYSLKAVATHYKKKKDARSHKRQRHAAHKHQHNYKNAVSHHYLNQKQHIHGSHTHGHNGDSKSTAAHLDNDLKAVAAHDQRKQDSKSKKHHNHAIRLHENDYNNEVLHHHLKQKQHHHENHMHGHNGDSKSTATYLDNDQYGDNLLGSSETNGSLLYDDNRAQTYELFNSYTNISEQETPDIEMALPQNQFPDSSVNQRTPAYFFSAGQDFYDQGNNSDSYADGVSFGVDDQGSATDQDIDATDVGLESVSGFEDMLQSAGGTVSGIKNMLGDVEQTANSIEGVVGEVANVEGQLSSVEELGSEAESAAVKIEGLKNAKAGFAKMVNLCSNPIDNLTQGDNVLSGIDKLAEHPDEIINQAESLINAGQQGIAAIANAQSPEDALGAIMGIAAQMGAGDSDEEADDEADANAADASPPDLASLYQSVNRHDRYADEQEYPEEFTNADRYGDA